MPDYYDGVVFNNSEIYEHIFDPRGISSVRQYRTKIFNLNKRRIKVRRYTWGQGDTLHRISLKFYNNPEHWWIIGLVNGKPTDGHYELGDTVLIPVNPGNVGA